MESSHNTPSLFDVIKQFDLLKVDDYQRTYAWTRDEISEFFTDLKDCVAQGDYHFFGTLIFQTDHDASLARVVDGQQRLTTVFIFVAALRDAIMHLGMDTLPRNEHRKLPIPVINNVWEFLYLNRDPENPRFESNRFLKPIFLQSIYPEPDEQKKIPDRETPLTLAFRKAVKYIRELIREDLEQFESKEDRLDRINAFIEAVKDRFLTLKVQTTNLSESLEIFLTLNNRGLPLGASDLVRGEILSRLGDGETDKAQAAIHKQVFEEWSDVADNVKEVEVFLRHYLVATGRTKVQKKKVFDTVVDRLKADTIDERRANAKYLWADLQQASEQYKQIISPIVSGDTKYQLEQLNGFMRSHRILLLCVLRREPSSQDFSRIVRQLYVLGFRWTMAGGNAQELEDKFQRWGAEFSDLPNIEKLINALADEARALNKQVIERALVEDADDGFLGKAVLHAINRARNSQANEIPMSAEVHLEHIAPQTATDYWRVALFDGEENEIEDYDALVSSIGNLTLLDVKLNISVKQKPIDVKSEKYEQSVIALSRDLARETIWDKAVIEQRNKYLTECFEHVFSIEPKPGDLPSLTDWRNRL